VRIVFNAPTVGNVAVDAPIGSAKLDISGLFGTIGDVTVDGALTMTSTAVTAVGTVTTGAGATLSTPALQSLGGLSVGGTLSLPKGLPTLRQCGNVTAGALATLAKNVQIGSGTVGSSMGRLRINAANRGKGIYGFAFANWPANATKQNPVAIVGGRIDQPPRRHRSEHRNASLAAPQQLQGAGLALLPGDPALLLQMAQAALDRGR
jgi:hypothetical protein